MIIQIFWVCFLLFFFSVANVWTQPAPQKPISGENRSDLQPTLLVIMLEAASTFADSPGQFKLSFGGDKYFKEISTKFPQYAKPLKKLINYEKLTPSQRRQEAGKAVTEMRQMANDSDKWLIDVGRRYGLIVMPFYSKFIWIGWLM